MLQLLSCPRCGAVVPPAEPSRHLGCSRCRAEGVGVNLECIPPTSGQVRAAMEQPVKDVPAGLWRYAAALPVAADAAVTLGEGGTPLIPMPRGAARIGVERLFAKNESANPTWSHKDRLSSLTVSAAAISGARAVTAASTGNHGASVAAYAARAGIPCVIFTLASVPETMKTLMQSYGAHVVALDTLEQRYAVMGQGIERFGWYAATNAVSPPVGSDPYGADGYKTIAYEIFEEMGRDVPEWIVLPVAVGDCLRGIVRGFQDLVAADLTTRIPRVAAAEVFPIIGRALDGGSLTDAAATRPTAAFSIATPYTTFQAVEAVRAADGVAVTVGEAELLEMQLTLGREGLFAEGASCVAFAGAERLVRLGTIRPDDRVVCLLTSSGLKDPFANRDRLTAVAHIEPTLDAFIQTLDDATAARLTA
ncbi:MAG: hypothetical protein JWM06_2244 [Actinomycetia bacterium]|nr:hypothetical protein [Actinomycetes bacterium]